MPIWRLHIVVAKLECFKRLVTLSGVHSNMMEKSAQTGESGGASPWGAPPFTISTITDKVVMYAAVAVEWADTLPLFLLYLFMNSVVTTKKSLPKSES